MKRLLLVCLLAAFAVHASYAQKRTEIDLAAIKGTVKDTAYYNNLKREFFKLHTLPTQDLVNLFYGQAFQADYSPYDKLIWQPAIDKIMKKDGAMSALAMCFRLLEERPAYLPLLNYTINVAESAKIDKSLLVAMVMNKVKLLVLIRESGDGTIDSPLLVTSISDEHLLMEVMKLQNNSQALMEKDGRHYDMWEVTPNEMYKSDKIYFDINLPYPELSKLFPEDETSDKN